MKKYINTLLGYSYMELTKKELVDWIITYFKNKDAILKNIVSIDKGKKFDVCINYEDKKVNVIVEPTITDFRKIISKFDVEGHFCLVVSNSTENLKVVIENWGKIIMFKNMGIYFVNPNSQTDKKWVIFPYVHNKICDEKTLKLGLKSMFDMVEAV